MVGSNEKLKCESKCSRVNLQLQGQKFNVDLFIIALKGASVGLELVWLQLHSNMSRDFKSM